MEEDNKDRPHVRIFGADVDHGASATKDSDQTANTSSTSNSKEDWRAQKAKWRAERQAQRDQWKMQHDEWRDYHHGYGGSFFGLVVLFAGVVALLYTMGYVSSAFWHAIEPFWPILLILWGASITLGRHWFSRFILFLFTLIFLAIVIIYGLAKVDSPLVSALPPHVASALGIVNPPQGHN